MERPRRHRQRGRDGFHRSPARRAEAEQVLANALRDARASAPPAQQLAALRFAQPRRVLVRLRQRLVGPLGVDEHTVLGLGEGHRSGEDLLEAVGVRRAREAKGDAAERNGPLEQVALDDHRRRRVALEEELAALGRNVGVVEHHSERVAAPLALGAEAGEGEGQVEVANAELGGAAQRAAAEQRVAPDPIRRQPVAAARLEPDAGHAAEAADDVPHHDQLLRCLGIQLKQAGIDSFTIFEKSDRLGGTWRDNTYPGAACDVPSFLYCFSFEQKTDWSRKWSPQTEIRDYMEHCARKYDLVRHIRFGTEIADARFDAGAGVWRLRTTGGEEIVADVLVSAVGQLNRPSLPDIPGLDRFRGACFHSARWDHRDDLAGKRVGVIGNAASAIQLVPQIAPKVQHLSIFQRSANWMLPRGDRAYTERERRWLTRFPLLARLHSWSIWLRLELRFPMICGHRFFAWRSWWS